MHLTKHINDMSVTTLPVTICIGIFSFLGIVGNCIVLFVYYRRYPKCNFKYFVLVLAGIDLGSCLILMPLEMYTLFNWFRFGYSWLCKTKSFLNVFTVTSSASMLLLIAIDRYRKVCSPHKKQIQPQFAIKLSLLVLFLSTIPSSSDAVFWGIHTHTYSTDTGNFTVRMCEKDDKYKETVLPQIHVAVLYAGVNVIIMVSTIVLYILIAVRLFCVPSGLPLGLPTPEIKIHVQTTDNEDSGVVTSENTRKERVETVFKFPTEVESGLSESEDLDGYSSVDLSDSQGNVTEESQDNVVDDDTGNNEDVNDVTVKIETDKELEMVPLRRRRSDGCLNTGSQKKILRLSIQGILGEGDRHSLQVPDVVMRRPPKSPRSPTSPSKQKVKQDAFKRRRSTIGSISTHTGIRLRRKTLIMFILTAIFVSTTLLYFCLIGLMASDESHFVTDLTISEQTTWLFFLRLYFVNSVINPILYGFLDSRFRRALFNMGIRISFAAGSLKRNIGQSIRRSRTSHTRNEVTTVRHRVKPRSILKSRSSTTVSD